LTTRKRATLSLSLRMSCRRPAALGISVPAVVAAVSPSDAWVKYEYGLSPDGKWVARHDVKADLLEVVRARGGGAPVPLLDPVAAYARLSVEVAWSPDGKALAIAGQTETSFERLYIVNADGTGLSAVPGVDSAKDPAWRP